ncbi:MAG: hypothetical protein ACR2HX_08090 [Pyrinomonadaceae bacterium]
MKNARRKNRKACLRCQAHQARFFIRGRIKWDQDHTLCFGCYRSLRDQVRAELLIASEVLCLGRNAFWLIKNRFLIHRAVKFFKTNYQMSWFGTVAALWGKRA